MLKDEIAPVRMVLNTDNQLILSFEIDQQIVNLKWDNINQAPYFQFNQLIVPPKINGGFAILTPKDNELSANYYQIIYNQPLASQSKYYVSSNGILKADYVINEFNKSFTCFNCALTIESNGNEHQWRFNFNITCDRRSDNSLYNYITLTGFTA